MLFSEIQPIYNLNNLTSKRDKYLPLLDKGLKTRSIGSTASNENSSRSHAIFRVTIARMSLQNDCDEQRKEAKLSLVDLAGKVF